MAKIVRALSHMVEYSKDDIFLFEHIKFDKRGLFELSSDELEELIKLQKDNETIYDRKFSLLANNFIYLDRHPELVEEYIKNEKFIKDYKEHIDEKFFIMYYIIED